MKIKLGLRGLSIPAKLQQGQTAIEMSRDNPKVSGNAEALTAFEEQQTRLRTALMTVAELEGTLRAARTALAAREREWDASYARLGMITESITKGDLPAMASAGFHLRRQATPPQPVTEPTQVRASLTEWPGQTRLSWKRPSGAVAFLLQCSEDPSDETNWRELPPVTDTEAVVDGAPVGGQCWFRLAAIGARGMSPWTPPLPRPLL